jgi:hypothetical protein
VIVSIIVACRSASDSLSISMALAASTRPGTWAWETSCRPTMCIICSSIIAPSPLSGIGVGWSSSGLTVPPSDWPLRT